MLFVYDTFLVFKSFNDVHFRSSETYPMYMQIYVIISFLDDYMFQFSNHLMALNGVTQDLIYLSGICLILCRFCE